MRSTNSDYCDILVHHPDGDVQVQFRLVPREDMLRLMVQTVHFSTSLHGRNRDVHRALAQVRKDLCENLYSDEYMVAVMAATDLFFVALESSPLGADNAFPEGHALRDKIFFGVAFVNAPLRATTSKGAYLELFCVGTPKSLGEGGRKGLQLGKRFLGFVEDVLYARDFRFVFLTPAVRVAFSRFYESMGFRCLHRDRSLRRTFLQDTESLGKNRDFKLLLSFEKYRRTSRGAALPPWNRRHDLMGSDPGADDEVCWNAAAIDRSPDATLLAAGWSTDAVRRYAALRDAPEEAPAPKKLRLRY